MLQALEEGVSPLELCTKFHQLHTEIYEWVLRSANLGKLMTDGSR